MKRLVSTLALLALPLSVHAAQFTRTIDVSSVDGTSNALLAVPETVLQYHSLSDLRIHKDGSPVAAKTSSAMRGKFLGIISDIELCSLEDGSKNSAVHDGSTATKSRPDAFKNPNSCSILIRFAVPVRVDTVSIAADKPITKLDVSARNTQGAKTLLRSVENARMANFSSVVATSLTVNLAYDVVPSISEITVEGQIPARMLFQVTPGSTYTLEYGDAAPATAPEAGNELFFDNNTPFVSAGTEKSVAGDSDGDGIDASRDNCPTVKNVDQKDSDADGLGDVCDNAPFAVNAPQNDRDHDGVGDAQDNCMYVFNPDQKDEDLDGVGWACDDADYDGTNNTNDNCPRLANRDQLDSDGNGIGDACELDRDGDELADERDNCRNDYNPGQEDSDNDGIGDVCDSCPNTANPAQTDKNENGIGDACEAAIQDPDSDGHDTGNDNCPSTPNPSQTDTDNDGRGDACDNCPTLQNANQADSDDDGQGNACTDADGDGYLPHIDNCPGVANEDQRDRDNDGRGDACEDEDGDGIINAMDNCPYKSNRNQKDGDQDGAGDACDEEDNRFSEQHAWVLWIGVTAVVLVIVFMAVRMIVQMKKEGIEAPTSEESPEE